MHCYVEIVVSGDIFILPRFQLDFVSDYFGQVFDSRNQSSDEIDTTDSHYGGIHSQITDMIIMYVYTKNIALDNQNIYEVTATVDYLCMWKLKSTCVKYLRTSITALTWMDTFRFAEVLNLKSVTEICTDIFPYLCHFLDLTPLNFKSFVSLMEVQKYKMNNSTIFDVIKFCTFS